MKITIQQTVDLGEIPLKIDQRVKDSVIQLQTILNILKSVDCTNSEKFMMQADFARRAMFAVDQSLEESVTLMAGYLRASTDNPANESRAAEEGALEESQASMKQILDDMSQLSEKINE